MQCLQYIYVTNDGGTQTFFLNFFCVTYFDDILVYNPTWKHTCNIQIRF